MSINLKAIREAEKKASDAPWFVGAFPNLTVAQIDSNDLDFIRLARNEMPKLLDWIDRAKGHVELSVLSTYCGNESPCLCPRCEAIALLAELEEQDQ